MQKVDGPKKKLGILSCSVKNKTECPYLLKYKMFWKFEKKINHLTQKVVKPTKKLGTLSCSVKNWTECP